ncbi:MAG: 16S rRNA (guanine(527)-N(7))-methyltransferase RsmG [bacterium]|nr:16S rRNA (guanine(527)-N(7))-methyltransferase RsmG [bacterium]
MTEEQFKEELVKLNLKLSDAQLQQLKLYADFLLEYNKHTNLTAIKTTEEVYLKHFYDSLTIIKTVDLSAIDSLLDIGTGAGFPGMVLKICYPNLNVTLMDSNNKKITFLNELATKLNIQVELVHARAEEFIKNRRETYDIVTSRAVADLAVLSELAIPYVKVNGYFIAMKSNYQSELENSKSILTKLSSKVIDIQEFSLPVENSNRALIKIQKYKPTSHVYPREYNKIIKQNTNLKIKHQK